MSNSTHFRLLSNSARLRPIRNEPSEYKYVHHEPCLHKPYLYKYQTPSFWECLPGNHKYENTPHVFLKLSLDCLLQSVLRPKNDMPSPCPCLGEITFVLYIFLIVMRLHLSTYNWTNL